MPSPFPGMDPYLEDPEIWPDLQHSLAVAISGELNGRLPAPYFARLGERRESGPVGESPRQLFVEIRDARSDHKLITLIEILSP